MVDVEDALVNDEVFDIVVEVVFEHINQTSVGDCGVDESLIYVQISNVELFIYYDRRVILLGVVDFEDADDMGVGLGNKGEHGYVFHVNCAFEEGLEDDLLFEFHAVDSLAHDVLPIVLAVLDGQLTVDLEQSEIFCEGVRVAGEPINISGSIVRGDVDFVDIL